MYLSEFYEYMQTEAIEDCPYCGGPLKYSETLGIGTIGTSDEEDPLLVSINIECMNCGNIVNVLNDFEFDF